MDKRTDPYRGGASAPPVVVDFRHFSVWWGPGLLAFFTGLLMLFSHRFSFSCQRAFAGGGSCVATETSRIFRHPPMRFDLANVQGARVEPTRKGGSQIAIVTTAGVVPLPGSDSIGQGGAQAAMVRAIEGFVADRAQVSLDDAYGSRWIASPWLLLVAALFAGVVGLITQRVRVVIDHRARQVRVERSELPFGTNVEGFDLGKVVGAEVERSGEGAAYRVSLILDGGQRVPLTENYTAGLGRKARAAEEIGDALDV
jgi:hypothetical protein